MTEISAPDSVPLSVLLYAYLDVCPREAVESFKPAYLHSLPQFQHIDPKLISEYLGKWKKKHPIGRPAESERNQTENQQSSPEIVTDVTNDLWKNSIIRLVNEADKMTPQIIDKIRDYLDYTESITKPPKPLLPPNKADLEALL